MFHPAPQNPTMAAFFRHWRKAFGIAAVVSLLLFGLAYYAVPLCLPLPDGITSGPPAGQVFLDRDGVVLRRLLADDLRAEEPARYEEFPSSLIAATLAAEDARFFSHGGVDFLGLARAGRDALLRKRIVSGASTITQQTIKLYRPAQPRSLRTKLMEMAMARSLEMSASKEEILTAYLNHLPYGNQYTGARAAARGYFGKPLADLSVAESALLAALPNQPSRLNPWRNEEGAIRRQEWVLSRLEETKALPPDLIAAARRESLALLPGPSGAFAAPHFIELTRHQASAEIAALAATGQPVRTTLDSELQSFVESTLLAELATLRHRAGEQYDLQAAVVVLDNASGDILALTGSRSFLGSETGQINGAWQPRSAGSTLKPFTYLLVLERGETAATVLADTPIEYVTSTGNYQPVNFDRRFRGPVTFRYALANSLNVPAVKLLDRIGGPARLHETLSRDLHFTSLRPTADEYGLGLTLGNAEVRLLELTNGYACLARLGVWKPVRFVLPSESLSTGPAEAGQRVFQADRTWLINDILSDSRARADAFGQHSSLDLPFRAAAKTGTSTDFRDSWTVGFTPEYTVGVWVGRFSNRPLQRISGAMGAAPVFHRILERLHRDHPSTWYAVPAGAVRRDFDPLTGKLVTPEVVKLPAERTRTEWFIDGGVPESASSADYTSDGRSILPLTYATWWRSEANTLPARAALAELSPNEAPPPFRIVSPLPGTVAFLDPDLPKEGSRFPLAISGSGLEDIQWTSESLQITRQGDRVWATLLAGEHEIVAEDIRTGRKVKTRFRVERL